MLKAQVLLSWEKTAEGNEPVITLQRGDSAMDVTGQPAVNLVPDPNLTIWELWTDDFAPYILDPAIHIISSITIDKEGEIVDNQPKKIDSDEAEKMRLYFVKVGIKQAGIDVITGGSISNQDYTELVDKLKVELKQLPKKKLIVRIK